MSSSSQQTWRRSIWSLTMSAKSLRWSLTNWRGTSGCIWSAIQFRESYSATLDATPAMKLTAHVATLSNGAYAVSSSTASIENIANQPAFFSTTLVSLSMIKNLLRRKNSNNFQGSQRLLLLSWESLSPWTKTCMFCTALETFALLRQNLFSLSKLWEVRFV